MQVFNFYNVDSYGHVVKGTNAYFIDENNEYYPKHAKVNRNFVGIYMSPFLKNFHRIGGNHPEIEERLYKAEGEYIPFVDDFVMRDKNSVAELYHKERNDSFQIKYLDYDSKKEHVEEYSSLENVKHVLKSLNLKYETSDIRSINIQTLYTI